MSLVTQGVENMEWDPLSITASFASLVNAASPVAGNVQSFAQSAVARINELAGSTGEKIASNLGKLGELAPDAMASAVKAVKSAGLTA